MINCHVMKPFLLMLVSQCATVGKIYFNFLSFFVCYWVGKTFVAELTRSREEQGTFAQTQEDGILQNPQVPWLLVRNLK